MIQYKFKAPQCQQGYIWHCMLIYHIWHPNRYIATCAVGPDSR